MNARQHVSQWVADGILALPSHSILRVGIDGDAGSGKSTFGDELETALVSSGRPIIRASADSFHHPREIRYRLGKMSPEGFFLDSYDYPLLKALLLDPLGQEKPGPYRRAGFDHRTDLPVDAPIEHAQPGSILIFDGLFLHRTELLGYWDYSVFLEVMPATGLRRCAQRGDGSPDPSAESNFRYVAGWKKYLQECSPETRATMRIENEDLANPRIKPCPAPVSWKSPS